MATPFQEAMYALIFKALEEGNETLCQMATGLLTIFGKQPIIGKVLIHQILLDANAPKRSIDYCCRLLGVITAIGEPLDIQDILLLDRLTSARDSAVRHAAQRAVNAVGPCGQARAAALAAEQTASNAVALNSSGQ